jgi:hypothetical protein
MDQAEKLNRYREILQQVVERHAAMATEPAEPESVPICDPVHGNYLLMDVGWEPEGRAYYVVFHLRLKDGKVRIERDGIEYGIARDLIEAGIPEEDIVMAYYGREPRPLTELMAA